MLKEGLQDFNGIVPPLVTPLTEDEKIDEEALQRLINRLINAKVKGVFILGSTGEFPYLSREEKKRLIMFTVNQVAGRVPVFVGASAMGTKKVLRNLETASKFGADAGVITPPFYFPLKQKEVLLFYKKIAKSSDIPIVVYNFPQITKVTIEIETLKELCEEKNIIGVKDTSGNFAYFQELIRNLKHRENFIIGQGDPSLILASLICGANCVISSVANVAPELHTRLYECVEKKDFREALLLQERITTLLKLEKGGISALKTALSILGLCSPFVTKPLLEVGSEERKEIKTILEECGLLRNSQRE